MGIIFSFLHDDRDFKATDHAIDASDELPETIRPIFLGEDEANSNIGSVVSDSSKTSLKSNQSSLQDNDDDDSSSIAPTSRRDAVASPTIGDELQDLSTSDDSENKHPSLRRNAATASMIRDDAHVVNAAVTIDPQNMNATTAEGGNRIFERRNAVVASAFTNDSQDLSTIEKDQVCVNHSMPRRNALVGSMICDDAQMVNAAVSINSPDVDTTTDGGDRTVKRASAVVASVNSDESQENRTTEADVKRRVQRRNAAMGSMISEDVQVVKAAFSADSLDEIIVATGGGDSTFRRRDAVVASIIADEQQDLSTKEPDDLTIDRPVKRRDAAMGSMISGDAQVVKAAINTDSPSLDVTETDREARTCKRRNAVVASVTSYESQDLSSKECDVVGVNRRVRGRNLVVGSMVCDDAQLVNSAIITGSLGSNTTASDHADRTFQRRGAVLIRNESHNFSATENDVANVHLSIQRRNAAVGSMISDDAQEMIAAIGNDSHQWDTTINSNGEHDQEEDNCTTSGTETNQSSQGSIKTPNDEAVMTFIKLCRSFFPKQDNVALDVDRTSVPRNTGLGLKNKYCTKTGPTFARKLVIIPEYCALTDEQLEMEKYLRDAKLNHRNGNIAEPPKIRRTVYFDELWLDVDTNSKTAPGDDTDLPHDVASLLDDLETRDPLPNSPKKGHLSLKKVVDAIKKSRVGKIAGRYSARKKVHPHTPKSNSLVR